MPSDVDRLLSVIKQADLPYQVFSEGPALERPPEERQFPILAIAANEDVAPTRTIAFQDLSPIEAEPVEPWPTPLADVFRRMTQG
jgi:hypothetical protein